MNIQGKVAIVTGGASGIGAQLVAQLLSRGARAVVVADLHEPKDLGADTLFMPCDASQEADIHRVVAHTKAQFGQVDIYCSNAGVLGKPGGLAQDDAVWETMWKLHGMAHVWAARAVVHDMVARGDGGFLVTASAAGLLNIVENAPYGVTKHAAVGFAEWLRIAYGQCGLHVTCLCPQGVNTDMLRDGAGSAGVDGLLSPEQVAAVALDALCQNRFLALPHERVEHYMQFKVQNYERWLTGMQKLYDSQPDSSFIRGI